MSSARPCGLTEAGAIKVFTDVRSGRTMERPGLAALLAYARNGDTLAVVRLDRLGRSLGELLTTVATLKERGIALLSLAIGCAGVQPANSGSLDDLFKTAR